MKLILTTEEHALFTGDCLHHSCSKCPFSGQDGDDCLVPDLRDNPHVTIEVEKKDE